MHFEHFAINVAEPCEMARWYVEQCGMKIVFEAPEAPFTHFLADETGRVAIEIYNNPPDAVPDYSSQHPLQFHFAFALDDPEETRDRLIAAGATLFEELHLDDGSHLVMLRDPWGVALQLCKRGTPFGLGDEKKSR